LSEHASAAGTERGSKRDFLLAGGGSGEKEARDIGAGYEEDERHRSPEDQERGSGASRDFFQVGDDDYPLTVVVGIGGREPRGDGVHLGARRFERASRGETGHGAEDVAPSVLPPLLRQRHRDPDLLIQRKEAARRLAMG
jgi:hypothetical protein